MKSLLILNMIMMTSLMLIIMFLTLNPNLHPIFTMIIIIIYSLLISIGLSMWKINFIYSFITFIIMISGLLIIFLYFSSLISNEQILPPLNRYKIISLIIFPLIFLTSLMNSNLFTHDQTHMYKGTLPLTNINEFEHSNIFNLYSYPYSYITMLSILFLLLSMFTIIKMVSTNPKPMRKVN